MERRYHAFFAVIGIIFISGCIQQISPEETEELNIKAYLTEKYNPGGCFGMPESIPEEVVIETLSKNTNLATFVKNRFDISEDYEIYTKIEQFNGVTLTKTEFGYDFVFSDGRCCDIHTYTGKIIVNPNQITDEITNQSTENVPC